jgi:hypothetical protein
LFIPVKKIAHVLAVSPRGRVIGPTSPRAYLERQPKGFDRPLSIPNAASLNPIPLTNQQPSSNQGLSGPNSTTTGSNINNANPNNNTNQSGGANANPNPNPNPNQSNLVVSSDLKTVSRVPPSSLPPSAIRLPMGTQINRGSAQVRHSFYSLFVRSFVLFVCLFGFSFWDFLSVLCVLLLITNFCSLLLES